MLWKKWWIIADFDCSGFVDDDAMGGTHVPPEFKKRMNMGKNPRLSHRGDAFALGVMLTDILSGFQFWHSIENDPEYDNYEVPFVIPDGIDPNIKPKLSAMIVKDPLNRITITAFSKSSIFKTMNTKTIEEIGNNNIKQVLGNIESKVSKVDSHVKQGMLAIDQKLTKLHRNLNEFLPAIQDNLMQVLSVTGVPNRFVLIPEKASFMDSFFKKYRLYFLCDCGNHLVKGDDIGYSMIQITELGKGIMIVAKVLISIAIKHLIGLAEPGILNGIESAAGLADQGMQLLPEIMKSNAVSGVRDINVDMRTLSDGLQSIEASLSTFQSDELLNFDIKGEDDWVRIFAPIKPILKRFLDGKSPEKMGVQVSRDKFGKATWLCQFHAKELSMLKPISNSVQSLKMSAELSAPPTYEQVKSFGGPKVSQENTRTKKILKNENDQNIQQSALITPKDAQPAAAVVQCVDINDKKSDLDNNPAGGPKRRLTRKKIILIAVLAAIFLFGVTAGIIYLVKSNSNTSSPLTATFAGSSPGLFDGTGNSASFNSPRGIVSDKQGNLYVADTLNNVIRKISPSGAVSTFAGSGIVGDLNGIGNNASFNNPGGISIDSSGTLYVADTGNHLIRKITSDRTVSTFAGSGIRGSTDDFTTNASFSSPQSLAVDGNGNIFIADTSNHKIRKITVSGQVSTFAGSGAPGSADNSMGIFATFNTPKGIAIDTTGNIYVSDTLNNKIRKITSLSAVSTFAGSGAQGSVDGTLTAASFFNPVGIAFDIADTMYIVDSMNNKIRRIRFQGNVETLAGTGSIGSTDGNSPAFNRPQGIVLDPAGNVFIADTENHSIRKIFLSTPGISLQSTLTTQSTTTSITSTTATGTISTASSQSPSPTSAPPLQPYVTTLAGSGASGSTDSVGTAATFNLPFGIISDSSGSSYITDSANNLIRKISNSGAVTTIAGTGSAGSTDGMGIAASFNNPYGITIDPTGILYVADRGNHKIRKITPDGNVTTLAGSGTLGSTDGVGVAASFVYPHGITFDSTNGVLVVADTNSNKIRKVTLGGVVTTFAGSGAQSSSDGMTTTASFNGPTGVVVDGNGNIFVADNFNNIIRRISSAGMVSTFAGSGSTGSLPGMGSAASFNLPYGITIDLNGTLYVTDYEGQQIRKITANGNVTTLAGSGVKGGVDGIGLAASFHYPRGITIDTQGNILVVDSSNNKVRKITFA